VAIDGSILELPNTPALAEAFGTLSELARARMSHPFDVANGHCLSATQAPCATSERDLARRNIAEVRRILGPGHCILWLEDRGYPWTAPKAFRPSRSGWSGITLAKNISCACPPTFYPEEFGPVARDEWVAITVTPNRAREFAA